MTEARGFKRLALALRRRRTIVVCVGVAMLALGIALVVLMPAQYRAEAAVKVIDARPPAEYVQPSFATPAVSDIVGERMKALRLHILNRPLLSQVAAETGLVAKAGGDARKALEALRDHFDFRVEGADTFTVAYTDTDSARAERVVNQLATAFMAQENQEIEGRASGTTRVLDETTRDLRAQLDAADQKIGAFKRVHYGALPEQQEENLRHLDQTQMEVNILETTLQSAMDRRRHLLENDISPLRKAEDEMSGRLSAARTQYTEDHPEVERLKDEYGRLRVARIEDERRLRHDTLTKDPEVQGVSREIGRLQSRMVDLRSRQSLLRAHVDQTAKNQQSLAALSIDRDVLKDKYTGTLAKLREAEASERLARDFRPYRFDVLEPAIRPVHAAAPNRPLLAVAALVVALLLALGAGLGLELVDPTVRDAGDVQQVAPDVPVLVAIPRIDPQPTRRAS
jgi:uncharacterized protein involved in exopolysaccharide biosynthesis